MAAKINKPGIGRRLHSNTASLNDDPLAGIVWVTISMLQLAGLACIARYAALGGMHPLQIVFLRNFFALLTMLPLLAWRGISLAQSRSYHLYGLRVVISLIAMSCWFYALSLISVGELTAISFLAPLFGTVGAVIFLGEIVGAKRWSAMFIGFLGAMVMLRPGVMAFGLGQGLALTAAASLGVVAVLIKHLTASDDPDKIVFITSLLLAPLSLMPALFVWQWPPLGMWPILAGMGLLAVGGHVTLVRGFATTDASLVLIFEFSRLPFAVALAYWAFGETIDLWTWIGALVIFASAVYIARREAALRQHKMMPLRRSSASADQQEHSANGRQQGPSSGTERQSSSSSGKTQGKS